MQKHQKEIERRRSMVLKPFKSPARQTAEAALPKSVPATPSARKRPTPEEKTTPLRSLLTQSAKRRRYQTTASSKSTGIPLSKQAPPPMLAVSAARGGSGGSGSGSKETQKLVQEKTQLMRQVARIKEEIALIERARVLETKNEAKVVGALIAKWQVACSTASDDLFELLKPAMEAQRQAAVAERMFGSAWGNTDDDRAALPREQASGSDQSEEDDGPADDPDADIDVPYMLKQFGIDAELF
ncbi:hypothetical protein IW140_002973 [Coemansia sp. RSA 1813]|nr:hypothetical protein EV178_003823 [Coemansia sp. RSA 1646]KAJ1770599.1 hypothetical protein LPJ74_003048 [Coemansia sp. RSA 1843]KAJ2091403.1 hypothetical protein IW138_001862 [Coemansia sp. RSA 986]KAJ2212840.1 hypothetical protein EV179_004327 [Coemansia sp. RSA 487]KAJ2569565.1 hypothetical protein IW140_002973 [Coemansia sp. RSA 1813]